MRNLFTRRRVAVLAAGAALVIGAGTALAFWSTTGSGTGTASTTGGSTGELSFTTSALTAMFPGDTAQGFTVTVKNNSSDGSTVRVASVTAYLTVTPVGVNVCDATNYLLDGVSTDTAALPVSLHWTAQQIASGNTAATGAGDTIQFNDKAAVNQDGCKGATVTLNYVAN